MKQPYVPILSNEQGMVLIVGLLVLAFLTMIGFASINTSTLEIQIATNDQNQKLAFYSSENGWPVAVVWLDSQYPLLSQDTADAVESDQDLNQYSVDISFLGASYKAGYSTDFMSYDYQVDSTGNGPDNTVSETIINSGKIEYIGGY